MERQLMMQDGGANSEAFLRYVAVCGVEPELLTTMCSPSGISTLTGVHTQTLLALTWLVHAGGKWQCWQ